MPRTLDWQQLLPEGRDADAAEPPSPARSPFQRDHDRILFSGSFRRLADKTQVFPLPFDDHVHSRLTHSLEVASLGRSLGTLVGRKLIERGHATSSDGDPRDIGDCVAAACLAHDLGNPPFGHAGERAIREYFERRAPRELMEGITPAERLDFTRFEGNAQGFRILTRLERPWRKVGLSLTHATLGAFMKYPCTADAADPGGPRRSLKKHGIMRPELRAWEAAAADLGLERASAGVNRWPRPPLAFLTEAVDDVAYLLLDLEDGFRLGVVAEPALLDLLRPLAGRSAADDDATRRLTSFNDRLDRAGWLRARAIDTLLAELGEAFVSHFEAIVQHRFDRELRSEITHKEELKAIEKTCSEKCYGARDVLKMELAGAEAIQGLLDCFARALLEPDTLQGMHQRSLLPHVFSGAASRYEQLVRITDHVAGMTDNYAVRLYRELRGMRYPGGRD